MPRDTGDWGKHKRGETTNFPPITDRDPELKTTKGKAVNPAKEEDTPMSTPV